MGAPPEWFRQNVEYLARDGGRWLADNSAFKSESEAWDAYGIEWIAGPANASMRGRLFGISGGKDSNEDFWVFSQYWNPADKQAVVEQYGWGAVGVGMTWPVNEKEELRMAQTFTGFDGEARQEGHRVINIDSDTHDTTSFAIDEVGKWTAIRTYRWLRAPVAKD